MLYLGGVFAAGSIVVLILGLSPSIGDPSRPVSSRVTPASRLSSSPPTRDSSLGRLGDGDLNRALRTSEPTNLDRTIEQPLLALATEVLLADLTGVGRERFPDYLPGGPAIQTYREARVQAAVARRIGDTTVETHLLWAGISPDGQYLERQTAVIRLRYLRQSWRPVRS